MKKIKRCFFLAFIPINKVLMEFEKIYFRKQFIAGDQNPDSVYSINYRNCYYRVINLIPRITNTLEGWHRGLKNPFNRAHSNLDAFITILSREEQRIFVKMTQIKAGNYYKVNIINFNKEYLFKKICENFEEFERVISLKIIDGF